MRTRVISGLVLAVLVVVVLAGPPELFFLTLLLVSGVGAYEFYGMARAGGYQPVSWVGSAAVLLLIADAYKAWGLAQPIVLGAVLLTILWQAVAFQLRRVAPPERVNLIAAAPTLPLRPAPQLDRLGVSKVWLNVALTLAGILYVGWLLRLGWYVYAESAWWLAFVLVCTTATDTGAYFSGTRWGKHKMIPWISPGKTWEGTIGGILTTIVVGGLLSFTGLLPLTWWGAAMLAGVLAVAAVSGDLIESMLKRAMGVKDSSHLIPGHGGLLDRIDSIILAVVVVYFYLHLQLFF